MIYTKNEEKTELFFEAILYVTRSGCPWRLLPAYYGHWRAIHRRFLRWTIRGIFTILYRSIQRSDLRIVMLDSTVVRAHPKASGYEKNGNNKQALGRSKGGFTTKLHVLTDALGHPLKFELTSGNRNDMTKAFDLVADIEEATVIADKAYDSNALISFLGKKKCKVVIPPRCHRKEKRDYDKEAYKERHLIENFFSKIKEFRRVFSRFEKTAVAYLGFVTFASTLLYLK
jgi:transposase